MTDLEKLEKRLANTELALHSLCAIITELQPLDYQKDLAAMMQMFLEANKKLGADPGEFFIT